MPNNTKQATQPPSPQSHYHTAYRTLPPIYDGKIAADVYDRAMAASVTLTQCELLSLSPEVRSQVREATSAKRTSNKDTNTKEIHSYVDDDELATALDNIEPGDPEHQLPTTTFINSIYQTQTPPAGSLIIPDPYDTYLRTIPAGAVPDRLVVAKESSALCSIHPLVDHQQHIVAVLLCSSATSDSIADTISRYWFPHTVLT